MANNKKAFVRFDANGIMVPGSLIYRPIKPVNGNWEEIPSDLCCDVVRMEATIPEFPAWPSVDIYCNNVYLNGYYPPVDDPVNNITEYVAALNAATVPNIPEGASGKFYVINDTTLGFILNTSYKAKYCSTGTLSIIAYI